VQQCLPRDLHKPNDPSVEHRLYVTIYGTYLIGRIILAALFDHLLDESSPLQDADFSNVADWKIRQSFE
jgi:hypothetical protein